MKKLYYMLLVCLLKYSSEAAKHSGQVFVVTPSPSSQQNNEARSAPFYYHNWLRRMDSPSNATVTTTSTTPKVKTPDLIFAEFESDAEGDMKKSIRKLLEQERITAKSSTTSTTTSQPIYVPEETNSNVNYDMSYAIPKQEMKKEDTDKSEVDMTDYFALYNNLYSDAKNKQHVPADSAPVYLPFTSTTTSTTTTMTTTPASIGVENIWHIIDKEKENNQYFDKWEEVALHSNDENDQTKVDDEKIQNNANKATQAEEDNDQMDENFALPGLDANSGNGAENESRAIRTEPNVRFPYVSLKPFLMKNLKKPLLDVFSNSKKGSNMFTSLDNYKEIKQPVRGEIQDVVPMRQPIDRYNPAQPYLPQEYGSKSKQSSPPSPPSKAVANLVPPPPPPPKATGDDFPVPTSYESFPPYPPFVSRPAPPPQAFSPPVSAYKPPAETPDDSGPADDDGNDSQMDLGYRYKPPSPPAFVPTLPPLNKPFNGYSYDKPGNGMGNAALGMDSGGYSYNKPAMPLDAPPAMGAGGYDYSKPAMSFDSPPTMGNGYSYNKPQEEAPPAQMDDEPDFHNFHDHSYDNSGPVDDHPASNYGHHNPSYNHDSDFPELIFNKPHGGMSGGHDMKGNDVAIMAPPPPPDEKPGMDSGPSMDDHGFPAGFLGDLKFHHDFDDHDFHYHHHPHTTTTTTETPRVNRYSYYYLGKKLYYLPLYFSIYFIVYVGALIIKAVLRHKIVYPNSWRPNGTTASFFAKRSVDSWDLSNENLHEMTGRVTKAIAEAAEKYVNETTKRK